MHHKFSITLYDHLIIEMRRKLKDLLTDLKGFIFVTTLILEFQKNSRYNETKYSTFYLPSKAEKNINETDVDDVFESIYSATILNIQ